MVSLPDTLRSFEVTPGRSGRCHSVLVLEQAGYRVSRMPACLRIILESLLRQRDGRRIRDEDVTALASWTPQGPRTAEIPFVVARVLLQDFTGVPVVVDLAAMRSAAQRIGADPRRIEPVVAVDLVIDHSVQVDYFGRADAAELNHELELTRNRPRYELLKWGAQAFRRLRIVPPGVGICHQVNLEHLSQGVLETEGLFYPDTLVGTDSHTTMVNGIGVLGWGVGGIEAEAAMLGQAVNILVPDVYGVRLEGRLSPGVTATDLVLQLTEILRNVGVVGRFIEFFGEGTASLTAAERATISNMAPEYGATVAFFPVDDATCRYYAETGRSAGQVAALRAYFAAQGMFGTPRAGDCDYTRVIELDLATVTPAVAGPKRPQERIPLHELKMKFWGALAAPLPGGYGKTLVDANRRVRVKVGLGDGTLGTIAGGGAQDDGRPPERWSEEEMINNRPTPDPLGPQRLVCGPREVEIGHGAVLIAAITSCTNTSNPSVMLSAGIVAKKAVEHGLTVPPWVKTSLAPGSRRVTEYLNNAGLARYLDQLGFQLVGYGCTTCIGNSGPLDPALEAAIASHDLVAAAVLSGNRNFEARVHQSLRANFLMSPPLVVAFALAGRVDIDFDHEPVGRALGGRDVYLDEIWPTPAELAAALESTADPGAYRRLYSGLDVAGMNPAWDRIASASDVTYAWDPNATYIREPPFLELGRATRGDIHDGRALAIFGDSITTDHISPAGAIKPASPAGRFLAGLGVPAHDFNSYGARRGNHEVMVRGTFANVRLKNLMVPGVEGGVTVHEPSGERMSIFDAAERYRNDGVPLFVLAGREYGAGSSRDWAAKGTRLLGVRAVVATTFERIHRSNLVGMGVLPCELPSDMTPHTLGLEGSERYDLIGLEEDGLGPKREAFLIIRRRDGREDRVAVRIRLDTPTELAYFVAGGILPFVLGQVYAV